ncbi:uncharacterized protein BDZ99DRAFT_500377 [Mytilinidion resinicola]|uniref:Uncharacterized protein n=1 Tax=Mytilinidion resinicola TaxID=574789 RepID=A0A6A6YEX6_9PEZI|nr:uncharacterized protein BDZ99DRAFT_500377 [Mytilinidion resinicola]KAF2807083.1 hypothetical protein BDZ99DRAFT_500377 [Mytilinidion resinicola]
MPLRSATQISGADPPSTPELQISPSRPPTPNAPRHGPNSQDWPTPEGLEDPRDLGSPIPTNTPRNEAAAIATDLNAENQTTTQIQVVEDPGNTITEALADFGILAQEEPPVEAEEIERRRLARRQQSLNTLLGDWGMQLTSMEDSYQDIGVKYHLTTDIARNKSLTREARDALSAAFSGQPRALMPLWDNHRRAVAHHNILRHALKEQVEDEGVYFARIANLMVRAEEELDTFHSHMQKVNGLVHRVEDVEIGLGTTGRYRRMYRANANARRLAGGYLADPRVHAWVRALPETPRQLALGLPLAQIIQGVFTSDETEQVSGSETSDDGSEHGSEHHPNDDSGDSSGQHHDDERGESGVSQSS